MGRRAATVALAATVAIAGCGDDDATTTTGSPATSTAAEATTTTAAATTTSSRATTSTTGGRQPALPRSCTHQERDVRVVVHYPEEWHVNDTQGTSPCTAFDPDPIDLRRGTELPRDLGVVVRVEPVSFDRLSATPGVRVERETTVRVDGRRGVRQEVVTTGEGLGPGGQRSVRYLVDGGPDRTVVATTYNVEGNDFARSTEILDAMVPAFDIEPRGAG